MTTGESGSPAASVWDLVCGLPSPANGKRLIMALQAYIDDSGGTEQNQHRYFVLAGFVSTVERWGSFSADWQDALSVEPSLKYFKMSEAGYLKGQFSLKNGWTRDLRDDRLQLLAKIISKYALFRLSVAINKRAFFRILSSGMPVAHKSLHNPYVIAFHKIVLGLPMMQALQDGPLRQLGKVDFIFDEQDPYSASALDAWRRLKHDVIPKLAMKGAPNPGPYLGSPPIFRTDRDFLPLQAADLYAWHVRRHWNETEHLSMPMRHALAQLTSIPGDDEKVDTPDLMDIRFRVLSSFATGGR